MKKLPATRATPVPPLPAVEEITDREPEQKMIHCVICGSDTHAASTDQMCWVCRRLKISAWRDIEPQVPVQE